MHGLNVYDIQSGTLCMFIAAAIGSQSAGCTDRRSAERVALLEAGRSAEWALSPTFALQTPAQCEDLES